MGNPSRILQDDITGSYVDYYASYLGDGAQNVILSHLQDINYINQGNRLTQFYSLCGCKYSYSGYTIPSAGWPPFIAELATMVGMQLGVVFTACNVNYYDQDRSYLGIHADDEPIWGNYGDNIVIASLSFGTSRKFTVEPIKGAAYYPKSQEPKKITTTLNSGDLLVMLGKCQSYFYHGIPYSTKNFGGRYNLTFRTIVKHNCPLINNINSVIPDDDDDDSKDDNGGDTAGGYGGSGYTCYSHSCGASSTTQGTYLSRRGNSGGGSIMKTVLGASLSHTPDNTPSNGAFALP